jgi:predicted TIM-barrel fold metal-dependent hydrolase
MQPSHGKISRRDVLVGTAQATLAATAAAKLQPLFAAQSQSEADGPVIWDAHTHLNGTSGTPEERVANLLFFADRVGIQRLIVFMGYPFLQDPSPDDVRRQNDQVMRAVDHSNGRALGFVYLNPKHTAESLEELDRCVRDGPLVGIKLWVAIRCADPCLDPIVERAIQLKIPVLQHTWQKATGNLPGESTASDLAALARRHPDASFIAAHVDGDWERGIREIRALENVSAEICGSDPTAGMVDMAVRELGAKRVIFGSDAGGRSYASQLAKVYGAEVPDEAKRLILAGNIQRLLQPILTEKGMNS